MTALEQKDKVVLLGGFLLGIVASALGIVLYDFFKRQPEITKEIEERRK